jgi:radical SAM superfamily enzyme YgiQ (UPF0313 family)
MRLALINAAFNRYGGVKGHGGTMAPLNLCYLAAYARSKHPDLGIDILDAEISGLSHEETVRGVRALSADLIGITANTCVFDSVTALTRMLKTALPSVPVVIGGPHPSAQPEAALEESGADYVVAGEGEETLAELISCLRENCGGFEKIPGLAYRADKRTVHINKPRELIEDLDSLPFPARDLINNAVYKPPPTKRVGFGANTLIAASRGCPYSCGFCGAHTVWTRKVRTRSPSSVIAEMEECVSRFRIRTFHFTDEMFTLDKKRVLEICRLMRERRLDIAWVCSARAQRLDKETLQAMRDAGCREISFGIESGNKDMLKKIDKGLDLEEARRVIQLAKKTGITTHASYIIGYAGETQKTVRDTINFANRLNTHVAAFFVASPLPGTPLYEEARRMKLLRPDAKWQDYSPLSNADPVMSLPDLPPKLIRKWHRRALRGYYLRPSYIISRLASLRHWYEVINLLNGLKIFFNIRN